jgi:hypothetical protein
MVEGIKSIDLCILIVFSTDRMGNEFIAVSLAICKCAFALGWFSYRCKDILLSSVCPDSPLKVLRCVNSK